MLKKIRKKIKKSEPVDWNGIFFYTLYVIRNFINIHFKNKIIYIMCYIKGVKLGNNITFNGVPIIRRYPNSSISFGSWCKFNSSRNSVIIRLSQPCVFATLSENAEISFGNNSGASGVKISARSKVEIGNNVLIGAGSNILDNDFHHSNFKKRGHMNIPAKPIIIEDNVFIGLNCTVLKGVKIGENSVIGAGSVVFNNIPANCIAIGNPCKVIIKNKTT